MKSILENNLRMFLEKLKKVGVGKPGNYSALCPAHAEKTPSLSVSFDGEIILVCCHAGCSFSSIIKAVGMHSHQFSVQKEKQRSFHPRTKRYGAKIGPDNKVRWFSREHGIEVVEAERYVYRKLDGSVSFHILRSDPKDFRPLNPDGHLDLNGVQRIPYRLPQLQAAIQLGNPVFLVEGEKDADLGTEAGLCCTTFSGGAGKWRGEYAERFRGADVLLIPDNDEPGKRGMCQIAEKLSPVAQGVRILELPGLPEKGDLCDWLAIPGNNGKKLMELVETASKDWTGIQDSIADTGLEKRQKAELMEPEPLPESQQPPVPLDLKLLPEPLADFCHASALENEVAPEALAGFLLTSIGAVTGTRFCIKPDSRKSSWFEFPIRSVALVMDVSMNKTGAYKAGIGLLEWLQESYKEVNKKTAREAIDRREIYERKRKAFLQGIEQAQKSGKPSTNLEDKLRMLEEPAPAEQKRLVLSSATRQKIIDLASRGNERGILIKRDELIGWLNELERSGGEGDREFFTEAMTVAHHFSHHTIGRGTDEVPILALSVAGCVQPRKLARHLRAMESGQKDDGLLQRFLWIWPAKPHFGNFDNAYAKGFRGLEPKLLGKLRNLFERLDSLNPELIGAVRSETAYAPWVGFEEDAQQAFLVWRENLKTKLMKQDSIPDGFVSWLNKSERLVAGMALSFHCIECAMGRKQSGTVSMSDLSQAVDVWDTLRHHALRVFDMGRTTPIEAAHLLLARLKALSPKFNLRELKRRGWRGLRDEKLLSDALDLLVDHRYIFELEPVRQPKGGRPASRNFSINPRAIENR